ncbi:MAG: response regulator [Cyclobacteriaceae bacterium]
MTPPPHVLIAEDDNDDFEFLNDAMINLNLSIVVDRAENGDILIKILDKSIPDLLFLDLLMPSKDGRQCLKEIRSNRKYDLLPIIIYSSVIAWKEVELCFREGANLFTIKPSSFGEVKVILEKIFAIDWKKSLYYPPLAQFVINPQHLV